MRHGAAQKEDIVAEPLAAQVARPAKAQPSAKRPFLIRMGSGLRPAVNWAAERASKVPISPIVRESVFPWTASTRHFWQGIAREADKVLEMREQLPRLRDVSPDHARIAGDGRWRCFFLCGYGTRIEANCRRAPITSTLMRRIPHLNSAFFSVLEPGAVIPPHVGVTKGLLTWHLGLRTPHDEANCWMRVGDERVHWRAGQSFLFDDTFEHEVRNDTDDYRVILLVQVERPMAYPLRILPDLFLWGIKRTSFVSEARRNISKFEEAARLIKQA